MIESADFKGIFLTAENGSICLQSKNPHSVQVWKLAANEANWVNFLGVPPDGTEGKVIGANMANFTLVYGGGMLEDFQLENDANDTFRVTFEYYDLGHYWQIVDGKSLSFTINLTYAAKWKLIEC